VIDHWTRKAATGANSWESYWETRDAPYRTELVAALRRVPPFTTLLEVGCGPGVNLWRVLEAFPDVDLTGFDLSDRAIENGRAKFLTAMANGTFAGSGRVALCSPDVPHEGCLVDALGQMDRVDVILACYSLAYVRPAQFHETMLALTTVARQAIVLAEPMVVVGDPPGVSQLLRRNPDEFKHDYLAWFRVCAPTWAVSLRPLHVHHMNRLLVARAGA
jgi:SAM-dependent methyltransferase